MAPSKGGVAALALASGQAAVTYSVLNVCRTGDNIVALSTLYGGTYNLFAHTLPQYGIEVKFVDPDKPEAWHSTSTTRPAWFGETIGNPRLNVVDIEVWANAAHAEGPCRWSSTTPPPGADQHSSSAPTSRSTRRPSSSVVTAPRSAV